MPPGYANHLYSELFTGKKPQIPFIDPSTFRRARQEPTAEQGRLF